MCVTSQQRSSLANPLKNNSQNNNLEFTVEGMKEKHKVN